MRIEHVATDILKRLADVDGYRVFPIHMHRGAYGILSRSIGINDLAGCLPFPDGLDWTRLSSNDKILQLWHRLIREERKDGGWNAGTGDLTPSQRIENKLRVVSLLFGNIINSSSRQ